MRQRASVSNGVFRVSGTPPFKRKKRLSLYFMALTSTALCIAAAMTAVMTGIPSIPRDGVALDRAATALGFGITRLEILGNRYTQRTDIVEALGLSSGASQLAFDTNTAKSRIEALPWVLKAGINRSLPDGIVVEITERRPAIVWRDLDRDVLLDKEGRELTTVPQGSDLGLPVVTGVAAGQAAPGFVNLLKQHAEIQRRTAESRRIEGRRWTIQLNDGTLVHLPAVGVAGSLAWLESQAASGLLDLGLEAIDLRVAGQLVVRKRDRTTSGASAWSRQSTRAATAAGGAP